MKNFDRNDLLFSLCGLNCGLCTMKLDGYCPGCGGGEGNQSCKIAKCSLQHGTVEYCFQCSEFPCGYYEHFEEYDIFITQQNRMKDLACAEKIGTEKYHGEIVEKIEILEYLLKYYNAGRQKSFFCTAVNLLTLEDVKAVMKEIAQKAPVDLLDKEDARNCVNAEKAVEISDPAELKKRALTAVDCFKRMGELRGVELKLRRKKK